MSDVVLAALKDVVVLVFLGAGTFFFAVGILGLIRLPDVFSRMHATAKSDTLGAGLILAALILHFGLQTVTLEIAAILLFIVITTPAATHIIARAANRVSGMADRTKQEDNADS